MATDSRKSRNAFAEHSIGDLNPAASAYANQRLQLKQQLFNFSEFRLHSPYATFDTT